VVGKQIYEAVQSIYKKSGNKKWELKAFTAKESAPWKVAVASAQKQLKAKQRVHPAVFLLSVVGQHLHDGSAALYAKPSKTKPAMKTMKTMKAMKAKK